MIGIGDPRGWWLFPLLAFFLIMLVRRLRRKSARLTTFFLLRRVAEDYAHLDRRFRILRRLSYGLFIAAALLTAVASLRPFYDTGTPPRREMLLVDLSPSLGSVEGGAHRFETVRGLLREYAGRLRREDDVFIVAAGPRPAVSGRLGGGSEAAAAAGKLEYADARADIGGALELAGSLRAGRKFDHVAIFTDRPWRWRESPSFGAVADLRPFFMGGGRGGPNAGITAFDLRRDLLEQDRYDLFITFRNHACGGQALAGPFTVTVSNNGGVRRKYSQECPPGEKREVVLEGVMLEPGKLEVRLEPGGIYPGDDAVLSGLSGPRVVKVTAYTRRGSFLEKALLSNPNIEARIVEPGESVPADDRSVYIFDSASGGAATPERALFIQPNQELEGIVYQTSLDTVNRVEWDRSDPVLRGVDLEWLGAGGVYGYQETPSFRSPATADGYPLILLSRGTANRRAVLAFDPGRSNFVYSPSYPVLVANLLNWLSAFPGEERNYFTAGTEVPLPQAASGGKVSAPSGVKIGLGSGGETVDFPPAARSGLYTVSDSGGDALGEFYVNTLDAAVTAEAAAPDYGVGETPLRPGDRRLLPAVLRPAPWIALAALLLLLAESRLARHQASGRE